jgi:hypothetical protein
MPARPATVLTLPEVQARRMPRLGWLEWIVISQTALPAMMYIPGASRYRFVSRILGTVLPLIAWGAVAMSGRQVVGGRRYPAATCLGFCTIWVLLSIAHPSTNSLLSGLAEATLTIAIFCPAFWAANLVTDTRQVRRLIVILLICNGASSLMGIAQVYQPERFRPPNLPNLALDAIETEMTVTTADGLKYLRPAGLTDSPGAAGMAGLLACLTGLAVALSSVAWKTRVVSLGMALIGLAVIFYSQVRFTLIVLVVGIVVWIGLLAMRRDKRKLITLGIFTVLLAFGATGWVMRSGGSEVMKRFLTLVEERADTVFYANRGKFVEYALTVDLIDYPLGAGIGRFGTMNSYFGDPFAPPSRGPLWCEIQIEGWILDGGAPLLLASVGAVITAMIVATLMALRCQDRELGYWATVVVIFGLFNTLSCLGNMPFLSPNGLQFWVLMGALFGADSVARRAAQKSSSPVPGVAS